MTVLRSDNYIGGMGAVVLANALKANSGLRELHIKGNELGDSGTTALSDALAGATLEPHIHTAPDAPPPAVIRQLWRQHTPNVAWQPGTWHLFSGACNGARHRNACAEPCNDSMTANVAKRIPVWDKSSCFESLGPTTERDIGMHVLDLGNNSMTAEGATALATCMEKHRELKDLNLYMNDIGRAGLEKVGRDALGQVNLKQLAVAHC